MIKTKTKKTKTKIKKTKKNKANKQIMATLRSEKNTTPLSTKDAMNLQKAEDGKTPQQQEQLSKQQQQQQQQQLSQKQEPQNKGQQWDKDQQQKKELGFKNGKYTSYCPSMYEIIDHVVFDCDDSESIILKAVWKSDPIKDIIQTNDVVIVKRRVNDSKVMEEYKMLQHLIEITSSSSSQSGSSTTTTSTITTSTFTAGTTTTTTTGNNTTTAPLFQKCIGYFCSEQESYVDLILQDGGIDLQVFFVTYYPVPPYFSENTISTKMMESITTRVRAISWIMNKVTHNLLRLHKLGLTHNDIKPENITFNIKKQEVTFIDFELCAKGVDVNVPGQANDLDGERLGTKYHIHPFLKQQRSLSLYHNDLWALGTTCLSLFSIFEIYESLETWYALTYDINWICRFKRFPQILTAHETFEMVYSFVTRLCNQKFVPSLENEHTILQEPFLWYCCEKKPSNLNHPLPLPGAFETKKQKSDYCLLNIKK